MVAFLDVSRLPTRAIVVGPDNGRFNVADTLPVLEAMVDDLTREGMIDPFESFGFAAANCVDNNAQIYWDWDDPYGYTWFVAGWGPKRNECIANAVRKLRPLLRTGMDTLVLRISEPDLFQDQVDAVDDEGNFPWGDFPWGGGTFVRVGNLLIPSAVSGGLEVDDDTMAKLGGGLVGSKTLKIVRPKDFGPGS